jgi:hypothetical protein
MLAGEEPRDQADDRQGPAARNRAPAHQAQDRAAGAVKEP